MVRHPISDREAARELYQSFDGMEGLPDLTPASARGGPLARALALVRAVWPGVLAAAVIALAATFLSDHYGGPVMLFALLIGMAFHFLSQEGRCVPGVGFASSRLIRLAVALLGAQITVGQIAALGAVPVAVVVAGVGLTIGFGVLLSRSLGLGTRTGVLTGGAVAICGASAAMAIAQVLPRGEHDERDTVFTVVGVTTLSTVAMVLYPLIPALMGLDDHGAGLFLGGTIHDVAQVVAAGYGVSHEAGDTATIVKLMRVALLLPVVALIAVAPLSGRAAPSRDGDKRAKLPIPLFLFGFAALVAINSAGLIPLEAGAAIKASSRALLVTAISALGMKTSLAALARVGARPVALMVGETLFLAAFVLTAAVLMEHYPT